MPEKYLRYVLFLERKEDTDNFMEKLLEIVRELFPQQQGQMRYVTEDEFPIAILKTAAYLYDESAIFVVYCTITSPDSIRKISEKLSEVAKVKVLLIKEDLAAI